MEQMIERKIKEVKKGDHHAFEEIVLLFQNRIYEHCLRLVGNPHEAEELAQEAFIRAYVNIHSYDLKRKFSTWLYRIATNVSIDRLRKRKPDYYLDATIQGTEKLNMYSQLAASDYIPEEELSARELQGFVHEQILNLPPLYKSIIVLRYLNDFSLKEISEMMDLPVGTIKTRLYRGRELLRKKLLSIKGRDLI